MKQSPSDRQYVMRILDASFNRASEALRVIEDYVRFAVNSEYLTRELKQMRHDLASIVGHLAGAELLTARDIVGDVGSGITTASEQVRENLKDVVRANMKRLQQSLRSLEEYGKSVSEAAGAACERLRYRSYRIEQHLFGSHDRWERLERACLYVLLDGRGSLEEFEATARLFVEAKVDVIQLRDKQLTDRELTLRGKSLHRAIHSSQNAREPLAEAAVHRPLFIMNDRPGLAIVCEADGVHVGQDELNVSDVRRIVGSEMLVGVSTHTIEQARQAIADNADYIGVGPVFPSQTKSFKSLAGLDLVRTVAVEKSRPAFAIGGIKLDNLSVVLETGIERIAVGNAILTSKDVAEEIRMFQENLAY